METGVQKKCVCGGGKHLRFSVLRNAPYTDRSARSGVLPPWNSRPSSASNHVVMADSKSARGSVSDRLCCQRIFHAIMYMATAPPYLATHALRDENDSTSLR